MTPAFLQRQPEPADRESWRDQLAAIPPTSHLAGRLALFVFRVGSERFGLEPIHFDLAAPLPSLHSVPHRGASLAGVVNVRGTVSLCFSLAHILGSPPAPPAARPMMLVLALHGWRVACRVDAAEGVTEFDRSSLIPVPATLDGARRAYVNGIFPSHNAQDIAWLNVDALFNAFEAATR